MTNERPLAAISDEIDRALGHIDAMLEARAKQVDSRFDRIDTRIDSLTTQVTATNGRVRELEMWRRYWEGVRAGAGGFWFYLAGGAGVVVGIIGLIVAIMSVN